MSFRTLIVITVLFLSSELLLAQVDSVLFTTDSVPALLPSRAGRVSLENINTQTNTIDTGQSTPFTSKIKQEKRHSPTTAVLLSIVPGAGQIYNKKWWKVPIIYAGLGVSGYFIYTNAVEMVRYQNEYFYRQHGAEEYYDPDLAKYRDPANILAEKRTYQRNMEIAIGVCAIIYLLNLVDALVDAHLFYFDVSDDLSLQLTPAFPTLEQRFNTFSPGLSLKLKF